MPAQAAIPVVAALIWRGPQFMICQRPGNKARGLLWEFPGGKQEPGETKAQALIRECQEELAVTLFVGDLYMQVQHMYPDITVELSLYHCKIAKGEPRMLEHAALRWITAGELDEYEFCPADAEIIVRLKRDFA